MLGCSLVYGLLQERIMQHPHSGGDVFSDTQSVFFLVFLNSGAGAVFALFMIGATGGNFRPEAELRKYFYVGLAQVVAGACAFGALKYLSYTVQAMGKSFKLMPVMLWSQVMSGKTYGPADWIVALLVTGGITVFVLTGPAASSSASGSIICGVPLLVVSIMSAGFIVTMQEKLFAENRTTKFNHLLYTTGMSSLASFGGVVLSGELAPALRFSFSHARFPWDAMVLSASWVGTQYFKYSLVKDFGALAFAATMNVRQVLSILLSYVTYHHHMTEAQALGLTAIFGALFYKTAASVAAKGDVQNDTKTS